MKKLIFGLSILAMASALTLTSCKKKVNPGFTATPTAALIGEPVHFTDSETGARKNATVSWDFGDGEKSWDRNPSHIYWKAGTYHVYQTVTINGNAEKGKGTSETFTLDVTVTNGTTSAFTASPATVAAGDAVTLTSTSVGANSYSYTYNSTNGENGSIASSPNATVVFTTPGTYTITLTTWNTSNGGADMATSTQTVTVSGTAPTANAAAKDMLLGKWTFVSDIGTVTGNGTAPTTMCPALPADGTYTPTPMHTSLNFHADGSAYIIENFGSNQTTGTPGTWSLSANAGWLTFGTASFVANVGFEFASTFKVVTLNASSLVLEIKDNCSTSSTTPAAVRTRTITLSR